MPGVEQGFKLALLTYFEMNLATSKVETSAQCLPLNRRQEVNWRSGDNAIIFFSFSSFSSSVPRHFQKCRRWRVRDQFKY